MGMSISLGSSVVEVTRTTKVPSLIFTSPDTVPLPFYDLRLILPSTSILIKPNQIEPINLNRRYSTSFPTNQQLLSSTTDRLITAQDHASIQIQVADVDADGKAIKGQGTTIAICGRIRAQGDSDDSINRIATKEGRGANALERMEYRVELPLGGNQDE
uniref:30S small subunit ribosomal protein S21e n=1 Tax=Kwoniella dejecticola CBS 10117 TaxID=1296121 RepID=A0A1A6A2S3_9TREE|nr:30S small subunit ribosomal protein S21e [Kwoniella dejecticola CBS 10117]OBR84356.1 30S small subunit ribosomal protein S21e [Kwoniella dejecticola CBS 10117]